MPKNTVSDPITDKEMAFAHLILSGTMNDRRAAEAVGLHPETAAYTKSKPRVRDYMMQHRAAVEERLIDQEVEGLRKLNLGRDQILARLWELATLSHEATRGNIAGQVKAMTMIVAIEGLIPGRRPSASLTQPTDQPVKPSFHTADLLREPQPEPAAPQMPKPELPPNPFPNLAKNPNQPGVLNPFINPEPISRVPEATGLFEAILDTTFDLRQPFIKTDSSARRR
jgi:hypothetical protein